MNNLLRVLHLGTEKTWRGGENQILLLVQGSTGKIENFVAYPQNSIGYQRFVEIVPTLKLHTGNPLDIRDLLAIINFCRMQKIDIIDAHSGNAHSLALMAKQLGLKVKLVVHRRVDNPIKNRWSTRTKYLTKSVDQFVAISDCIGKMLTDFGVDPEKTAVVRSAVDPARYEKIDSTLEKHKLIKKYNLNPRAVLLGNASAMTHQKGYEVLLPAVAELKKQNLNFHCFIAGDGFLKESLLKMASDLNINNKVTFLGFIDWVPQLLSALDILAVPSNNEGLGTIILDGICAGCTVAATEVGGIPEMIVNGKTGLLSLVGNSTELTHNLAQLILDPQLRQRLNQSAILHVKEYFSLQAMVSGNLEVYKKLFSVI